MAEHYRAALDAAIKEYEDLGQRRREIDDRLAQLSQTIGTLNRLLGLTPTVPLGLTDACRLALRGAGLPLTPLELRDRLASIGFNLAVYTNELSAIHTILKRLNEAGEIRFVPKGAGKTAYIWNYGAAPVALTKEVVQRMREGDEAAQAAAGPAKAGRKKKERR
jgi:hypothetical protein